MRACKSRHSGDLYEIQYVVYGTIGYLAACYRLSGYDGMPIGGLVWLPVDEFIDDDRRRVAKMIEDGSISQRNKEK